MTSKSKTVHNPVTKALKTQRMLAGYLRQVMGAQGTVRMPWDLYQHGAFEKETLHPLMNESNAIVAQLKELEIKIRAVMQNIPKTPTGN